RRLGVVPLPQGGALWTSGILPLLLLLIGCDSGGPSDPPRAPASLTVQPASLTLPDGATGQLEGRVVDQAGERMTEVAVTWSSVDEAVASVNASGVVTALRPGATAVVAAAGDVSGRASVVVERVATQLVTVGSTEREGEAGATLPDSA